MTTTSRHRTRLVLIGVCLVGARVSGGADEPLPALPPSAVVRDSVALARIATGPLVIVANRRSHSLTLVDIQQGVVVDELGFPGEPVDIAANPTDGRVFVADATGKRVVELTLHERRLAVTRSHAVDRAPSRLALSHDGRRLAVASLWSHRITLIEDFDDPVFTLIPLSFSPGELLWLPDSRSLLVSDAFGGNLAVVSAASCTVLRVHELPVHNVRGLSLTDDGGSVLFAHQVLHGDVTTSHDDITAGRLIENVVRTLSIASLLGAELAADAGTIVRLGTPESGAGDPAAVLSLSSHRWLTLLSGRSELLLHDDSGKELGRFPVGAGPVRWLPLPDRHEVLVLSRFGQSLALFDLVAERIHRTISLGELPPLAPRDRGERLFFDARLSAGGWLSCHSCHPGGHSTDALADTFADGSFGTPKRVPSLLGTRDNNPWGWNGTFRELHTQVAQSVTSSMQGRPLAASQVNDLVAYLHSLDAPPSVDQPAVDDARQALLQRGREVFDQQGCAACHVPPLTYTSDGLFDVGLSDEQGLRKYNPPSLVGLSHRRRFFHDGRAASLREVVVDEAHQVESNLPAEEVGALIAFLLSL